VALTVGEGVRVAVWVRVGDAVLLGVGLFCGTDVCEAVGSRSGVAGWQAASQRHIPISPKDDIFFTFTKRLFLSIEFITVNRESVFRKIRIDEDIHTPLKREPISIAACYAFHLPEQAS